jgi:acetyl esterase/lipase
MNVEPAAVQQPVQAIPGTNVDVEIGDPRFSYEAAALSPDMRHLVWLEGRTHVVWMCDVDATTGDLRPLSGKDVQLGTLPFDSEWLPYWSVDSDVAALSFQSTDSQIVAVRIAPRSRPAITRAPHNRAPRKHSLPVRAARRLSLDVAHVREDRRSLIGPDHVWTFACVRPRMSLVWQLHRLDAGTGTAALRRGPVHRDVAYGVGARKALFMDIYEPAAHDVPVPAIVYIHGGGWVRGVKSGELDMIDIQALVEAGFLVAAVDYRLSPEYRFPAQVEDVKCAVRYVRSHATDWGIDAGRIGAAGGSAGGHLAAMLGLTTGADGLEGTGGWSDSSSAVQAVCDMYGPADLAADYNRLSRVVEFLVLRRTEKNAPELAVASPVTYVRGAAPPFLLLHGDRDEVVTLNQSRLLHQRLLDAGVPSRLVIAHNAAHCFRPAHGPVTPSRSELARIMCRFFARTLNAASCE